MRTGAQNQIHTQPAQLAARERTHVYIILSDGRRSRRGYPVWPDGSMLLAVMHRAPGVNDYTTRHRYVRHLLGLLMVRLQPLL